MTLIPCASEKLFRPWDSDCGARKETSTPIMKEEPDRRISSPASSSSGASSSDESEASSLMGGSTYSSAIHHAYSASMMSAALGHHHSFPASPFLPALPGWLPHMPANTFRTSMDIHHEAFAPVHRSSPSAEAPSMERFLASLESSPEALHPSRLAALGMGPNDIGELYQLAGFKPIHHYPSAVSMSSASHPTGKKQRPKRFRCPHCQVAFSNNGQLKGHVRSHTGKFQSSKSLNN